MAGQWPLVILYVLYLQAVQIAGPCKGSFKMAWITGKNREIWGKRSAAKLL
jgi:hypothetical protein